MPLFAELVEPWFSANTSFRNMKEKSPATSTHSMILVLLLVPLLRCTARLSCAPRSSFSRVLYSEEFRTSESPRGTKAYASHWCWGCGTNLRSSGVRTRYIAVFAVYLAVDAFISGYAAAGCRPHLVETLVSSQGRAFFTQTAPFRELVLCRHPCIYSVPPSCGLALPQAVQENTMGEGFLWLLTHVTNQCTCRSSSIMFSSTICTD